MMVELITIYACIYIVIVVQRICPQAPKKKEEKKKNTLCITTT
jgi:hypothetical protein